MTGEQEDQDLENLVDKPGEEDVCFCCQKKFNKNDKCVQCFLCELWAHVKCSGLAADCTKIIGSKKYEGMTWTCRSCKSFAAKYSKTSLMIEERITKVEKEMKRVEVLEKEMKELQKIVNDIQVLPRENGDNDVIFEELRERENRKDNLVIYDIPEPQANTGDQRAEIDRKRFTEVLDRLNIKISKGDIRFMTRLGRYDNSRTRPALIGIQNPGLKEKILLKAPLLNTMREPYCRVKIVKDLTRKQREEEEKLKSIANDRNIAMSNDDKKNFQWMVVGRRGERRLQRMRRREDTDLQDAQETQERPTQAGLQARRGEWDQEGPGLPPRSQERGDSRRDGWDQEVTYSHPRSQQRGGSRRDQWDQEATLLRPRSLQRSTATSHREWEGQTPPLPGAGRREGLNLGTTLLPPPSSSLGTDSALSKSTSLETRSEYEDRGVHYTPTSARPQSPEPVHPGNRKCGSSQCVTCEYLIEGPSFRSSVTQHSYQFVPKVSCTDKSVIYLVTCDTCRKQYVGKTKQTLKKRHYGHRKEIDNQSSSLGRHFSDTCCGKKSWRIQIIDQCPESELKGREGYWIKELRSISPDGLNIRGEREW